MSNFDNNKKTKLMKEDKSFKTSWDRRIISLCDKINENPDYCTTSSCAGRIILIKEIPEKKPGLFLWVSHNIASFDELSKEIEKAAKNKEDVIYLKQEPCVLAVSCKSLEKAQELVDKARKVGWKRSGITTSTGNHIVELFSTERMDMPVINKGKIMVDSECLKFLLGEANSKLARSWEKIERLKEII